MLNEEKYKKQIQKILTVYSFFYFFILLLAVVGGNHCPQNVRPGMLMIDWDVVDWTSTPSSSSIRTFKIVRYVFKIILNLFTPTKLRI